MKILVLDNYDSFTYNLVHLLKKISKAEIEVYRNDMIALEEVNNFDKIMISPGPGIPSEAGILPDLIQEYGHQKSILGICLGMQAIGEAYGAKLINLPEVFHGVATETRVIKPGKLFRHLPEKFQTGRYHSWAVDHKNFPATLEILAEDEEGHIMALAHKTLDVCGVQFHPESILTEYGEELIKNWLI